MNEGFGKDLFREEVRAIHELPDSEICFHHPLPENHTD